ncbi:MAG: hypothetical protein KDD62_16285, partial [Bdellovibrionales bacterium]|nr:hypothetical protein [Bdellovibrionales bacterium]
YAFNLIMKEPDVQLRDRVMKCLTEHGIEFRRGSAGGGNQIRQPYLKSLELDPKNFPVLDHVHFFGFYIGNYPDLSSEEISWLCNVINNA